MTRPDAARLAALFALQDDGTLVWLKPPKRHPGLKGRPAGGLKQTNIGQWYWYVQIDGRKTKRARVVFCMTRGRWPHPEVDHINGDSCDDRPTNLREATREQNIWNRRGQRKASVLPRGVTVASPSGRFKARITCNKTKYALGTFDTVHEAERAYRAARRLFFGEFA